MKIVILTVAWYGGGAESIARESFEYFSENNIDVSFIYGRGESIVNDYIYKINIKSELYMHVLQARLFDLAGRGSLFSTKKIIKKIKEINPDIIQLHNINCYFVNFKYLFNELRKMKCPIVWTLHDCWAYTGHCLFYDEYSCNRWKGNCGHCPSKKDFPKSLFIDNSSNNLKYKKYVLSNISNLTLVAPSEWLSKEVKKSYLNQYHCYVINNGIDIDKYKKTLSNNRKKYNIQNKNIILGVASKWANRKGLKYFLELDNIIDHEKYVIVIIGDTLNLKIPLSIIHIERTNSIEELVQWYSIADVFLNPTISDNFPTVNLEALACGTPVVTFDTGGSWESVGYEYGEKCNKDVNSIYFSVKKCIERQISPQKCIEHAKKYNRYTQYNKYLELYKKLINNKA